MKPKPDTTVPEFDLAPFGLLGEEDRIEIINRVMQAYSFEVEVRTIADRRERLIAFHDQTLRLLTSRRAEFASRLLAIVGANYENFGINRELAELIQDEANALRVLFECPQCHEPARFKCSQAGGAKNGRFSFAHGSKTTHAYSDAVPELKLVDRPEDLRKSGKDLDDSVKAE